MINAGDFIRITEPRIGRTNRIYGPVTIDPNDDAFFFVHTEQGYLSFVRKGSQVTKKVKITKNMLRILTSIRENPEVLTHLIKGNDHD